MTTLFGRGSGGKTLFGTRPDEDDKYNLDRVGRSIDNARTRIEDAGFNPGDADKRNWFEKATNLPENQNFLFDALELIGRPGQAVMGAVDAAVSGGNPLKQAVQGFTGQEKFRGSELIDDIGVDNKVARAILGTGLEIALDPLTFVPGGALLKGAKGVANFAAKPLQAGYNALESASPQLRQLREQTVQPALERTRDALGRAFVPDYKLGEDLYGRADDTILRSKQATENTMRYMNENLMRNVADEAKKAGGIETGVDVGRIMEAPLRQTNKKFTLPDGNVTDNEDYVRKLLNDKYKAIRASGLTADQRNVIREDIKKLRDTLKNPTEEVIERPVRELSQNPAIRQAAENLMRSNNELRQWALDNGIQVGELEGYMTHVLAAEERKRRKNLNAMPIDRGNFGTGQPSKNVLKQRTLMGSAEDVNEEVGRQFFEPNAFFATAIGQKRLIDYVNAAKFRREVLSNPNFAQKYEKGMTIPNNAVVIDTNNYKFIDDDAARELGLASEVGGQYVVTKSVKQALDRYKKLTTDEGINAFLNAFDAAQSFWKRTTLFSLPYHLRNAVGGMFNNYVGGMNSASLIKYTEQARRDVYDAVIKGKETELFKEYRKQGLGSSSLSGVEFARGGVEPEEAIAKTIQKRSQFDGTLGGRLKAEAKSLKNPMNAFETSREFGDFIDQINRFALFKWARDKGMSPEQAAQKVREVQFDYTRTTPFEREVMVRAMPFYRWMRNNLPFQIQQFLNDPRKYANVNKLRLNATEAAGIEDEDVPDWMKEQFAIPVFGNEEGAKALGFNLPIGDLARLNDPLKMIMDSITPAAKLPAELALNRSFFYDRPIQEFEGQERQLAIPESFYGIPIPGGGTRLPSSLEPNETLAYILEQIGGQPVRQTLKTLAAPEGEDQKRKFLDPVLGISSMLKDINPQQSQYFQRLEELQRLQDLMDYIEQQTGQRPRTINEIR